MARELRPPLVSRAPRYPIRIALRCRASRDRDWHDGYTENISRSGVLFRSTHLMPERTRIEMLLALPVEVGGGENATVICHGRVVRVEVAPGSDAHALMAATIAGYRLTHAPGDSRDT